MPYTKPDLAAFAALPEPYDFVVLLDSGEFVAIDAVIAVEPNTGNPKVHVAACVVDATGAFAPDANGQLVETSFCHTSNPTEVDNLGGPNEVAARVIKLVLGEDSSPLWMDEWSATVREHASIRTKILAAASAGRLTDLGDLI